MDIKSGKGSNQGDVFIDAALEEALNAINNNDGGPFGAVIVQNNVIIARGHNMVIGSKDPTAHAEIVAIRRASLILNRFDLSDCDIYSTCEPCPMCLSAIFWARIKTLRYGCSKKDAAAIGFDDELFYELIKGDSNKYLDIIQTDRDKCLKLFNIWKTKENKIQY